METLDHDLVNFQETLSPYQSSKLRKARLTHIVIVLRPVDLHPASQIHAEQKSLHGNILECEGGTTGDLNIRADVGGALRISTTEADVRSFPSLSSDSMSWPYSDFPTERPKLQIPLSHAHASSGVLHLMTYVCAGSRPRSSCVWLVANAAARAPRRAGGQG